MKPALRRNSPGVNRHLYIIFSLLVLSLLVTLGFILHREANPEWLRHQKANFREETKKVTKAIARAAGAQRAILQKRLRHLERPRYGIRQILLEDGKRIDRCITCHLDLKELEQKHSQICGPLAQTQIQAFRPGQKQAAGSAKERA